VFAPRLKPGAAVSDNPHMATVASDSARRASRKGIPFRDVVVIGAGPYGLAAAAHLRAAGVDAAVFGDPMSSWERHMPAGMLLRSRREASNLADPDHRHGLDRFEQIHGLDAVDPVPVERFVAYGRWFQEQLVSGVDRRRVVRVETDGSGFLVELEDGELVNSRRVVVAAGILPFARRLAELARLPDHLISHTADHDDFGRFAGERVAVVGAGQSALESAALLAEAGASPEVLARRPAIRWLAEDGDLGATSLRLYAYRRIALGGPRSSWLIALPALWRKLPLEPRERLAARAIGPAGAGWLRPRLEGVSTTTSARIATASVTPDGVRLKLESGEEREFDHVLLATGYKVDVGRYPFLAPGVLNRLPRLHGHPLLRKGFESSVPGLHFIGAPAAVSFGPAMRFVCGTWAAARGLTRGVVGRGAPRAGFSW
jgi:hypothetical protein